MLLDLVLEVVLWATHGLRATRLQNRTGDERDDDDDDNGDGDSE